MKRSKVWISFFILCMLSFGAGMVRAEENTQDEAEGQSALFDDTYALFVNGRSSLTEGEEASQDLMECLRDNAVCQDEYHSSRFSYDAKKDPVSPEELLAAVGDAYRLAEKDDLCVFYYCGDTLDEDKLCTRKKFLHWRCRGLAFSDLAEALGNVDCGRMLVILDCGCSSRFIDEAAASLSEEQAGKLAILTASRDEADQKGDGERCSLTRDICAGLRELDLPADRDGDRAVSLEEIFDYVCSRSQERRKAALELSGEGGEDPGTAGQEPERCPADDGQAFYRPEADRYLLSFAGDSSIPVVFSERFFEESSYQYQHELALASLCLQVGCYTGKSSLTWGARGGDDGGTAAARTKYVAAALRELGFKSVQCVNFGKSLNEEPDKAAYVIAEKKLASGATLLAVVIRGVEYGVEWGNNIRVGDGSLFHEGFSLAAEGVYQDLEKRLSETDGPVKIWISGFSRSAAIGNLTAAWLDDLAVLRPELVSAEDVFTYLFATPGCVTEAGDPEDVRYQNIYNIVNPGDIIPRLPPAEWGFTRYGITKEFDRMADRAVFDAVNEQFARFMKDAVGESENVGEKYRQSVQALLASALKALPEDSGLWELVSYYETLFRTRNLAFDAQENVDQDFPLSHVTDILVRRCPDAESAQKVMAVAEEYITFVETRKLVKQADADGRMTAVWKRGSLKDYLEEKYGSIYWQAHRKVLRMELKPMLLTELVQEILQIAANTYSYEILQKLNAWMQEYRNHIWPVVRDEVESFLVLCTIHDITVTFKDIRDLFTDFFLGGILFDVLLLHFTLPEGISNSFGTVAESHYTKIYLAWMFQDERDVFGGKAAPCYTADLRQE